MFIGACAAPQATGPERSSVPSIEKADELERLVADVCDKQVVLLGEADHGDGRTWEVKTRLVRDLVQKCGFNSVFIESGIYDFLALDHAYARGTASSRDMANAVGNLWSQARETQQWLADLHQAAAAGTVEVRGLDDQIHFTAFYAQRELPAVLAAHLSGERRAECAATLSRHSTWAYDEAHPYTPETNEELLTCLRQVRDALAAEARSEQTTEHLAMANSLYRWVSRGFERDGRAITHARDASMFENFQWQRERLGPKAKSIVWCANIHAAKTLSGLERYRGVASLGQHIHEHYGERAAAIGFSAYSGASQPRGRPGRELSVAPPESLEGQVLAPEQELRYLNASELGALGTVDARPINHEFYRADWHEVLDGLVVFRREEPAHHEKARRDPTAGADGGN
ncbi:erythromycin esterase family protein [Pyxidicoccus parkwayensis]|uniref:Erythromycin esterase family protein n=1 Tax=Pyxidicoccus parkwayensis TaxID=2813578 RepID=A0ABX7P070_9BACT|nr:erythromycin esterase family protein [Pyxidicoccus parkwaysis]QSQ24479.1 erythromycin esterase family protein [Pyxidicoccus parkwaysis]